MFEIMMILKSFRGIRKPPLSALISLKLKEEQMIDLIFSALLAVAVLSYIFYPLFKDNNKMKKLTLKLIWGMIIFFCLSVVPHKYGRMQQE